MIRALCEQSKGSLLSQNHASHDVRPMPLALYHNGRITDEIQLHPTSTLRKGNNQMSAVPVNIKRRSDKSTVEEKNHLSNQNIPSSDHRHGRKTDLALEVSEMVQHVYHHFRTLENDTQINY
jgi:hypothetical protein